MSVGVSLVPAPVVVVGVGVMEVAVGGVMVSVTVAAGERISNMMWNTWVVTTASVSVTPVGQVEATLGSMPSMLMVDGWVWR